MMPGQSSSPHETSTPSVDAKTPSLTLHHAPGACSQVSLCALEQARLDYALSVVDFARGGNLTSDYVLVSPLGKVPALVIDGEPLTENAAILTYIAELRPEAELLPRPGSPRDRAEAVSGLAFCGGTLHPIIRGLLLPQRVTTGDEAGVRERSEELAFKAFAHAERRMAQRGWWLGQQSIIDVYLNWTVSIALRAQYDMSGFPELVRLSGRLSDRPAFLRMLEIDENCRAELASAGGGDPSGSRPAAAPKGGG